MIRRIVRSGTVVGVVVALVTATVGVASAAPARFAAAAVHSGGAGATGTSITGALSWSTSLKTVTLSDVRTFLKAGECNSLLIGGYQGSTLVTQQYGWDLKCATPSGDVVETYTPFSLTSGPPGGVQWVRILITDESHVITGYAYCYQSQSSCQTGQY
ncbi:hypothetical protein [Saccharothrix syringae]|uniref:Uncharacterized protein n=1 Tax=Saccharothrix syringae TaxID=103733 RepID=A0A5Q0H3B6_SACSY|nr:hypothetical protein [Saccharothrix syringae]QFZ20757.1 hypothetical protein EKG83_28160 [Saccharothrix syringae]